ncbi:MAG: hypothetical protein KC583_15205, partial [Myxococcales bacterium]|nr:hypothetical protein [Myxococcales bacterium]
AGLLWNARPAEVGAHFAGCKSCAAFVAESRRGPAAIPGIDADAVFGKILARVETQAEAPAAPSRPSLWARLAAFFDVRAMGALAAAAAAVIVFFALRPSTQPGTPIGGDPFGVRAKGDLALELVRKTPGGAERMVSGDKFGANDEIRFVVTLPDKGRVEIVGVEASGDLYTAWPLPEHQADPVLPKGSKQSLPGAVQLDGQPGTERLYLAFCPPTTAPACTSAGAEAAPHCAEACRLTPFVVVKAAP